MSNISALPDASVLWEWFIYNPLTGVLIWAKRSNSKVPEGSVAGTKSKSHLRLRFQGGAYAVHRIIYKWVTGEEPGPVVEHLDDNGFNNRFWNLEDSDQRSNVRTMWKHKNGEFQGYSVQNGRYKANIRIDNHLHHLGHFDTPEEARAAHLKALDSYTNDSTWRPTKQ